MKSIVTAVFCLLNLLTASGHATDDAHLPSWQDGGTKSAIIGKRPILAGGNSDGDFEMLEWTTAGDGLRLALIVHHTDTERAFAYDRNSSIGRLARGLDEGPDRGWIIIDMAQDWIRIWP